MFNFESDAKIPIRNPNRVVGAFVDFEFLFCVANSFVYGMYGTTCTTALQKFTVQMIECEQH